MQKLFTMSLASLSGLGIPGKTEGALQSIQLALLAA